MIILLNLLLLAGAVFGLMVAIKRMPPQKRGKAAVALTVTLLVIVLFYLAATRRLYLLGALLAALVPFARRFMPLIIRSIPFLVAWQRRRQRKANAASGAGQQSRVEARILTMTLDHDSGEMQGDVLEGPFAGRTLDDLDDAQFIELLQYCRREDEESARLLEAYLDKRFGEAWRADDPGERTEQNRQSNNADDGPMSDAQAYEILGLAPGADRDAIIEAHRRLMQRLHPDRGGSPYLAARINAARSHLLGE